MSTSRGISHRGNGAKFVTLSLSCKNMLSRRFGRKACPVVPFVQSYVPLSRWKKSVPTCPVFQKRAVPHFVPFATPFISDIYKTRDI